MGMLAVEGSYDKMEALLNQNIHPDDILLFMAASEGDKPKIEELMRAGANHTIKDAQEYLPAAGADQLSMQVRRSHANDVEGAATRNGIQKGRNARDERNDGESSTKCGMQMPEKCRMNAV